MANNELLNKIEELNSWEQLMEEARAEAEALRAILKSWNVDSTSSVGPAS